MHGYDFWYHQVISLLLIIAIGRAIPPTLLPSEQVMAQIQVNISL